MIGKNMTRMEYWIHQQEVADLKAQVAALEARARWADEVARPALEKQPCYWAIPCADMRARFKPEHQDCHRCAALAAYPQVQGQDVAL